MDRSGRDLFGSGSHQWWTSGMVWMVVLVVWIAAAGCTLSDASNCSSDDDCATEEYCLEGGGLFSRDGICVAHELGVGDDADVGIDADASRCDDDERSGQQTDVDCGGPNCPPCAPGQACETGSDCTTGVCEQGICAEDQSCPGDEVMCSESCVDLSTDIDHCGECGEECIDGQICDEGTCRCDGDTDRCGDRCVDQQTDADHCGGCDVSCGDDEICEEGDCVCDQGLSRCEGACVDTDSTHAHCGGCGESCGELEVCAGGHCLDDCPDGQSVCDDGCHDLDTSANHCGSCHNDCSTGVDGAVAICDDGICEVECSFSEYTLCSAQGVCADLDSDDDHCGGCGNSCGSDESCAGGQCDCDYECCDDGDCIGNSLLCSDNSCVECVDDGHCASGEVCDSGADECVDCLDDSDCGEHEFCDAQICEPLAPFVYTASTDETVRKIDAEGDEVWVYAGHGDSVRDVAVDPEGYVYTASSDETIRKLNPEGQLEWNYTDPDESMMAVAVDSEGNVYGGASDGEIHKISSGGNQIWTYDEHDGGINDLAVDLDEDVYVAAEPGDDSLYGLFKLDSSGDKQWEQHDEEQIFGVAVDTTSNVYVAISGMGLVEKRDASGQLLWEYDDYPSSDIVMDVDVGSERATSVTLRTTDNSSVNVKTDQGDHVWAEEFSERLISVAIDADSNVYFSEFHNEPLRKIDPDGEVVWTFEEHDNSVRGIAVDPGHYGVFPDEWD